ncbi:unnamed protein product [Aphanomyces euteiches]|uniref:Anoctamin transmembrane domain-containing protein n=1 Tax=Aphanomyces euteiches TaxID=100861 RepID=A0A6G0WW66_9STRA|nr:hypothetical protein Ae201684_011069 [Aphanomyces euteiches]KAH9058455.1 hypothetical protein Ae201684P_005798 [Aphanomyces euteiches]KAH9132858.1 hypothetical protein AeRB84_020922 [Aphanomyces euteiches]
MSETHDGALPRQEAAAIEACVDEILTDTSSRDALTIDIADEMNDAAVERKLSRASSLPQSTLTFHFAILVKLPRLADMTFDPIVLGGLHDLSKRLALSGFLVRLESRAAFSKKHAPHLKLVFLLHAPDNILADMQSKMEIERWVAGGRNAQHFLAPLEHAPLTSADRIVLVDRLLHLPPRHGGLGLQDVACPFKAFPLHDDKFNREYLKPWLLQWRDYLRNDNRDYIEKTRLHFGEKAALYFAYMDFYTKWLLPLAVWGLFTYFLSAFSVPLYFQLSAITGIAVSTIWGTLFLIFWKRKRSELRLAWGVGAQEHIHVVNPHFRPQPTAAGLNYIKWTRRLKYVVGYLILVVFIVGEIVITIGFVDLYFYLKAGCGGHCSPDGLENWLLVLCQGILLGLVVDIIQYQIFRVLAIALTKWENHPTEKRYESSRALKVFLWDFFGIYSWFWMCAFVYVPYGSEFSKLLNEYELLPWRSSYEPGLLELQSMFVTPLVATQGLKIVFEKIIPYFLLQAGRRARESRGFYDVYHSTLAQSFSRMKQSNMTLSSPRKTPRLSTFLPSAIFTNKFGSKKLAQIPPPAEQIQPVETPSKPSPPPPRRRPRSAKRRHVDSSAQQDAKFQQEQQWFLDRVLEQAHQSPHDLFADYADALVQFGYVIQFTCVWPFIPLCALLNNVFEVRSTAFQMAYASARVVPQRTSSIGSWNLFLRFNTFWAIYINVGLVCYASGLLESFFPECVSQQAAVGYAQHLPPMVPNFNCISTTTRFSIILILEHLLVLVYFVLINSIHTVPSSIKSILKTKEKVLKEHFATTGGGGGATAIHVPTDDELAQNEMSHQVLQNQLVAALATGLSATSTSSDANVSPLPTI